MKVYVVYGQDGTITSVGCAGPEAGGQIRLLPEEGQQVAEIEVPGLTLNVDLKDERNLQQLLDLSRRYRVAVGYDGPFLLEQDANGGMGERTSPANSRGAGRR